MASTGIQKQIISKSLELQRHLLVVHKKSDFAEIQVKLENKRSQGLGIFAEENNALSTETCHFNTIESPIQVNSITSIFVS